MLFLRSLIIQVYLFSYNTHLKPEGGVKSGQNFSAPFKSKEAQASATSSWKDDWADCTRYGILHPSFLNACMCPLILLGQTMTRLKLDWLGDPAPAGEWTKTFPTFAYITIAYFILSIILSPDDDDDCSSLYNVVNVLYEAFVVFIIFKVRHNIRARKKIPETRCFGCEDICCAFFCGCCTTSQMARETTDYDEEDAYYFSNTGLVPSETVMIV
jgi:Cys-rich protein (TIGR01571 family)